MAAHELKGDAHPITTTTTLSKEHRHMKITIVKASKVLLSHVKHVRVYGNDALEGKVRP